MDDEAVDADSLGEERVAADQIDGADDGFGDAGESGEPVGQVDAGVGEDIEGGLGDAGGFDLVEDGIGGEAGHAAVVVADDEDFFGLEGIDGDKDGAHDGAEGVGDDGAGVLDDFDVAVAEVHGLGEQFDEACVHAGEDDHAFFGVAIGAVGFVVFAGDEFGIVREDFGEFGHGGILPENRV